MIFATFPNLFMNLSIPLSLLQVMAILPPPPTGTPAQLAAGAITFFTVWIARMGGLVAFVGAVKFALSIKSEDANEKVLAAMTMVSGFMIVVLQIAVIVVMFMVFVGMQRYFTNAANGFAQTKFIQIIVLVTLGLGVIKSGAWSRKVCGL
jgi:hypothetical protein